MKKTKLIGILKRLETWELVQFRKYVQSPYFNKHQDVLALFDYLVRFAPDFEDDALQKKLVKQEISATDALMEDKHFYNVTSYLLELLCGFISVVEQENNQLQQKNYTLQGLRKRNLAVQISATIRQQQVQLERYPYKDNSFYLEQYHFYNEMDLLFLEQKSRDFDENLQLKSDYLDVFYLSSKFKLACDMASRNIVIKANYDCQLIDDLLSYYIPNSSRYEAFPSINIYYQILKMLTDDDAYYHQLKNSLEAQVAHFSMEEAKLMYDYAENYCIRKINSGQSSYYKEFLDLYKIQLKHKILFKNGFLDERDYKNIVTVGLRLKDYEWTELFIRQNKSKLIQDVQENAFVYNLAAFYYATQQYTKALRLLNTVEFTDVTYHLGAKDIQLKSYYELGESEPFSSLINAFRIYIKRNKQLSEYRKEVYLNYLKFAQKIEQLQQKKGFMSKEKFNKEYQGLETEILNTKAIANSDWIEQVLGAL